jgi:predicted NUDIX family phosphoesterase
MEQELCNLRDELHDVEIERDSLVAELENADEQWDLEKFKRRTLQKEFAEEVQIANQDLSKQVCTYLDIIAEYENIVDQYVGHTGVKLVTTKINDLKKKGELIV